MSVLKGDASADIDAPIDACWAVVEDVASAPDWQGGLARMEVVERDPEGRVAVGDALSDLKLRKVRTLTRFTYEGPTRLSWKMLEGDLDFMEGYWELEDLGDGRTRATYGVAVDPGSFPRFARPPIERAARSILINPRPQELARRVEGG